MLLGPAVYVGTSLYLRGSRRLGGDDDDGGDDGMSFEIDSGNKGFDAFFLWFFIAVLVKNGGSATDREYAKLIFPVRQNGNRLLCTLLLGNVAVNALLSITLAPPRAPSRLPHVDGAHRRLREILPQALCSRHALYIGASTLPVVKLFMVLMSPIASLAGADAARRGRGHGAHEARDAPVHEGAPAPGHFDDESGNVMRGALEMKEKSVHEVMTPLEDAFMLPESTTLSFKVVREIFEQGFARARVPGRAPAHRGPALRQGFDLRRPEDDAAASLLSIFSRGLQVVDETNTLDDVLRIFKRGHGHLALVRRGDAAAADATTRAARAKARGAPRVGDADAAVGRLHRLAEQDGAPAVHARGYFGAEKVECGDFDGGVELADSPPTPRAAGDPEQFVGIVTLEDIVEEIIGDEIIDETDVFVDVDNHIKVAGRGDFDFTKLRRLDAEFVDERLSLEEVQAVTAHFMTNVRQLNSPANEDDGSRLLNHDEMSALVRRSRVVELRRRTKNAHADVIKDEDKIYVRGEAAAFATLVLNGKLSVLAGKDGFRRGGPCAHVATESVRCIYVHRAEYARAVAGPRRARGASAATSTSDGEVQYSDDGGRLRPRGSQGRAARRAALGDGRAAPAPRVDGRRDRRRFKKETIGKFHSARRTATRS
ncbi:hypothetical protein JL722_13294 [Aureococcus anophagefferens]|nr:hypothetical protein JL722_13294 [Aureococcus anophagefferens]